MRHQLVRLSMKLKQSSDVDLDGNEEYLIKWKDYSEDENTWELTHNLDKGALEEARVYRMNSCPQISAVAHDHTLKRPFENGHHSKHVANDIYEVEAVVGHRLRDGNEEYLIKWKDYSEDENTWEPTHNLDGGVLEEARVYRATQLSLEGQKIESDRSSKRKKAGHRVSPSLTSPSPPKLTIAEKPTQIFSDVEAVDCTSANQLARVRKSSVSILVQRRNELVEAYELENKDSSLFWVEFVSDGKCEAVSSDRIFRGRYCNLFKPDWQKKPEVAAGQLWTVKSLTDRAKTNKDESRTGAAREA